MSGNLGTLTSPCLTHWGCQVGVVASSADQLKKSGSGMAFAAVPGEDGVGYLHCM